MFVLYYSLFCFHLNVLFFFLNSKLFSSFKNLDTTSFFSNSFFYISSKIYLFQYQTLTMADSFIHWETPLCRQPIEYFLLILFYYAKIIKIQRSFFLFTNIHPFTWQVIIHGATLHAHFDPGGATVFPFTCTPMIGLLLHFTCQFW